MSRELLEPFEQALELDERLSEEYLAELIEQGYSHQQILRQTTALRENQPLDELPLAMTAEDYYDYMGRGNTLGGVEWESDEEFHARVNNPNSPGYIPTLKTNEISDFWREALGLVFLNNVAF